MTVKQRTQTYFRNPAEAFEARTEWDGDCLIWVGSRNKAGYGVIRDKGKNVYAHRYAYYTEHGEIESGLLVDHMCHVRACCNVAHLRAVTNKQNLENRTSLESSNTSGHRNVYWYKRLNNWWVQLINNGKSVPGGYYPKYELHVAAYHARLLRDRVFTHHDSKELLK